MKKLLAMLTSISTIGSIMPMILANAPRKIENNNLQVNNLKRNKRETTLLNDYLESGNKDTKYFEKIEGIKESVDNLLFDKNQDIYFSIGGGLWFLKRGQTTAIGIEELKNNITIITINNNILYVGTDNGAYFLEQDKKQLTKVEGLIGRINKIVFDSNNNVYFVVDYDYSKYLYMLKNKTKRAIKINGISKEYYFSIFIDKNNNVYANTSNEIFIVKQNETRVSKIGGFPEDIHSIKVDNINNIYFFSNNAVYVLKQDSKTITNIDGLFHQVDEVVIDKNNNVYFATIMGGIYKLNSGETTVTKIEGINDNVSQIVIDTQNNVYFLVPYSGVYVIKNNTNTIIKIDGINSDTYGFEISFNSDDDVYFGNVDVAYKLKKDSIKATKIEGINGAIKSIFFGNEYTYFTTITKGFYKLKHGENTATKIKNTDNVSNFITDGEDNIYFGTSNGVYLLKNGQSTPIIKKITGITGRQDNSFIIDKNNNVYILTPNDIYLFKSEKEELVILNTDFNITNVFLNKNKSIVFFETSNGFFMLKIEKDIPVIKKIYGIELKNKIKSVVADSDNMYIATINGLFILRQDKTEVTKIEGISGEISNIKIDNSNNVFFKLDNYFYKLNSGETTVTKIEGISGEISNIKIDNSNNVFFKLDNYFYKLNSGETTVTKIEGINDKDIELVGINKNDNIIFKKEIHGAFGGGAWILNKGDVAAKKIIGITEYVYNIYFFENDIYFNVRRSGGYVLKQGEIEAKRLEDINGIIHSITKDSQGNTYFNANYGFYILKYGENKPIKIEGIENVKLVVVDKSDNLYILTRDEEVYFLKNDLITIKGVNSLMKNNINSIIFDKTQNVLSFNNLLKLAFFLYYNDFVLLFDLKDVTNINIDNLSFGNVEITRNKDSKLLHSVNFKNACFEKKTYNNKSSLSKIIVIPPCEYNSKSKLVFQIITGLSKNGQGQAKKENGWNINPDDEIKLHDFINLNNKQSEIINDLSNEFDLSNINKQEQEMILHPFNKKTEFEAEINPQEQAVVKYSVRETNNETTLNLKQKIRGTITAKIIDDNNKEQTIILSIKEAMLILRKYSLLPDEITINEDNSITFNGKAKISLTQEAEPKLIINTSIV